MAVMFLVGFFQALFLTVLIVMKKKKQRSDLFLALFILVTGLQLLYVYLLSIPQMLARNWLIWADIIHWTLLGPLLLMYVQTLIFPLRKLKIADLIHLGPLILVILCYGDYLLNWIGKIGLDDYTLAHQGNPTLFAGSMIWGFSSVVYYIITAILIYRNQSRIRNYFSFHQSIDLKWLNYLTHGFGLFLLLLVIQLLSYTYDFQFITFNLLKYSWLVMIVYLFGMGIYGIRQQGVFREFDPSEPSTRILNGVENGGLVSVRYRTSNLSDHEREKILVRLQKYMEDEQPWIDCHLDIKTVADATGTTIHKLSQVINESLTRNFYDFVNEYRIEEVKRRLLDPANQQFKIIAVAYDCGFNSKSVFYEVFRKSVGKTPSQFRHLSVSG